MIPTTGLSVLYRRQWTDRQDHHRFLKARRKANHERFAHKHKTPHNEEASHRTCATTSNSAADLYQLFSTLFYSLHPLSGWVRSNPAWSTGEESCSCESAPFCEPFLLPAPSRRSRFRQSSPGESEQITSLRSRPTAPCYPWGGSGPGDYSTAGGREKKRRAGGMEGLGKR